MSRENPPDLPGSPGSTIADQAVLIGETLTDFRVDPDSFFQQFDLKVSGTVSPFTRFPATMMAEVWNQAEIACNNPGFRRQAFSHLGPQFYHLLPAALISSNNLVDAIMIMARYSQVISEAAVVKIEEREDHVSVIVSESRKQKSPAALDILKRYVFSLPSYFSSASDSAVTLKFTAAESEVDQQLWGDMNSMMEFDANVDAVCFDKELLRGCECRDETDNRKLLGYLDSYIISLRRSEQYRLSLGLQIQSLLEEGKVSLRELARINHVSPRSLQRKLGKSGTSFKMETSAIRCQKANEYLSDSNLSITSIAHLLAYSDGSHFANDFRNITGMAPRDYRLQCEFKQL